MGYFDKIRKRQAQEKLVQQVLSSPEVKRELKEMEDRAVLNALGRFTFIMCGFLETRHGYKTKGLKKFLAYVSTCLKCTDDNQLFFKEHYEYYKEELGLDVLGELGLGLEE